MSRTKRRRHSEEFKREAVRLVTEQGYSLAEAATIRGEVHR
ncbi:MAG: transposase [Planctomycetaceae bacterium]|nr:transposase [Planctomycetaceae bacterium]